MFFFLKNKLRQLDDKQQELIRDNLELKELCLYLDEERANLASNIPTSCSNCGASIRTTSTTASNLRDDGDGSSSSTNDEPMPSARQFDQNIPVNSIQYFLLLFLLSFCIFYLLSSFSLIFLFSIKFQPELNARSALNDQTLQYVRSLERRLMEHELANTNQNTINENMNVTTNTNKTSTTTNGNNTSNSNSNVKATENAQNTNIRSNDILSGRPEAVVRALQILEVREQLERDRAGNPSSISPEHMDDGEKALLREMCNVVWRKLEDHPNHQDQI